MIPESHYIAGSLILAAPTVIAIALAIALHRN